MTIVAEIRRLDDSFDVVPLARLLVRPDGGIDVLELHPNGGAIARDLLDESLQDPFGHTVSNADGADFVRTLRWARSTDRLWVTPLVELPGEQAGDPRTELPMPPVPHVAATVPYPEQPPPELAGFDVVELRRPGTDDYLRREVVARLVQDPTGAVRVEGPDPARVLRIDALYARAGRPPLDRLGEVPLPTGTHAVPRPFERPGDQAWRDGLVGTRKVADAAGDRTAVTRLDREFAALLPRVWLSRCPFTGEVLRLALDGWGFDGPYWDPVHPLRPVDEVPATFVGLAGAVVDPAAAEHPEITPETLGPGRPPVYAELLGDPDTRAVLAAVRVAGLRCDVVAYFSRRRPAGPAPFREWGTRAAGRVAGLTPATDLEPLLRGGRLRWIEPFDGGVTLREGPEGCPWLPS
ncbi:hypothetical protein ACPPVO_26470 [Dactylosporangium sp. McL0621]|uniref:hypothetical protein n=1 Tax=Dactylosporangium sp. McL0621 TaxID=3415678 RepID=UPI003CF10CFE